MQELLGKLTTSTPRPWSPPVAAGIDLARGRRVLKYAGVLVASMGVATAEPSSKPVPIALSINSPVSWVRGASVAVSVNTGITRWLALRANVASHSFYATNLTGQIVAAAVAADCACRQHSGRITDGSVAAQFFYVRPDGNPAYWTGAFVELGGLLRVRDERVDAGQIYFSDFTTEVTDTMIFGGRTLLGVSAAYHRFFFAVAGGVSVGYERGAERLRRETLSSEYEEVFDTGGPVHRTHVGFEAYLRFGTSFEI
ncbi:MAG: hypothetical protein ACKV2T_06485 [Kofleriaceae bacterium]